ncbi:hypothetical protein VCR31J2_130057 [Vibrio coralliirubri]|uniref:Uncharacterized protein n=1 Tax=Vibrio coralliirubri TaxID=1516159 RepID=A0AA86X111_9VIBR|nr:hypothetical protein VCR31J2_130057 [Vibrio coralliirubri]
MLSLTALDYVSLYLWLLIRWLTFSERLESSISYYFELADKASSFQ